MQDTANAPAELGKISPIAAALDENSEHIIALSVVINQLEQVLDPVLLPVPQNSSDVQTNSQPARGGLHILAESSRIMVVCNHLLVVYTVLSTGSKLSNFIGGYVLHRFLLITSVVGNELILFLNPCFYMGLV